MRSLLPFDSGKYMKRMAKALNSNPHGGFYYDFIRWTRASVHTSEGVSMLKITHPVNARHERCMSFYTLENVHFGNGNGGEVLASRES